MSDERGSFPDHLPLRDGSALARCTECGCVQIDAGDHYLGCARVLVWDVSTRPSDAQESYRRELEARLNVDPSFVAELAVSSPKDARAERENLRAGEYGTGTDD